MPDAALPWCLPRVATASAFGRAGGGGPGGQGHHPRQRRRWGGDAVGGLLSRTARHAAQRGAPVRRPCGRASAAHAGHHLALEQHMQTCTHACTRTTHMHVHVHVHHMHMHMPCTCTCTCTCHARAWCKLMMSRCIRASSSFSVCIWSTLGWGQRYFRVGLRIGLRVRTRVRVRVRVRVGVRSLGRRGCRPRG